MMNIFAPQRFWALNLPNFFYVNVSERLRRHCPLSYNASIAIFLLCIKCVYVHRSHGNAFSCNTCCLSPAMFQLCGGDVFMFGFEGLNIFSKSVYLSMFYSQNPNSRHSCISVHAYKNHHKSIF